MQRLIETLVRTRHAVLIAVLTAAVFVVGAFARVEDFAAARNIRPSWGWLLWGLLGLWAGFAVYGMLTGGCPMSSPCHRPCGY